MRSRRLLICLICLGFTLAVDSARAQPVPRVAPLPVPLPAPLSAPQSASTPIQLPPMTAGQVSVSGLSAGAFMAVQFEVAFSRTVTGAGIIAGGPYFCSQGSVFTATTTCSCTSDLFLCRVRAGGTLVPELIAITDWFAASQAIDPTSALASHRIWMLSGSADTVVPTAVVNDLRAFYRHYVDASRISYKRNLAAQHAMPTDGYGNSCATLGAPFINNCAYDAAGELLKWIYGNLNPRSTAGASGRFIEFDQGEFVEHATAHGMARSGYLYVPAACDQNGGQGCRLHVVFHGCLQNAGTIGDQFIRHTGYNAWADTNRILVLYPQAAPVPLANPNACWDWFNYDDIRFAQKSGRQMAALKRMVDRLTGAPAPAATSAPPSAPARNAIKGDAYVSNVLGVGSAAALPLERQRRAGNRPGAILQCHPGACGRPLGRTPRL
jgi:poly(3-hydroxybutyrate) depolymerase